MTGSTVSADKRPAYVTWVIIGLVVLALLLIIIIYVMWKKISVLEIKAMTLGKASDDAKLDITQLRTDMGKKDEKIATVERDSLELKHQLKAVKKMSKKVVPCEGADCVMAVQSKSASSVEEV